MMIFNRPDFAQRNFVASNAFQTSEVLSRTECALQCLNKDGGCLAFNYPCDGSVHGDCELVAFTLPTADTMIFKDGYCFHQMQTKQVNNGPENIMTQTETTTSASEEIEEPIFVGLQAKNGSDCVLEEGYLDTKAVSETPSSVSNPQYGCSVLNAGPHEVHVISVYKSADDNAPNNIPVIIRQKEGSKYRSIALILTSYLDVTWNIFSMDPVIIVTDLFILHGKITGGQYTFNTTSAFNAPAKTVSERYYGYGDTQTGLAELMSYLNSNGVDFVTSMSGIKQTTGFTLTIGL